MDIVVYFIECLLFNEKYICKVYFLKEMVNSVM